MIKRESIEYSIKFIQIRELKKEIQDLSTNNYSKMSSFRLYSRNWSSKEIRLVRGRTALAKQIPFNPRLRNQNFTVKKITLNRVLTLADCRSRRPLSESVFRSQKGPLGVELWSFYCKKRISVPMSYITFLHSSISLQKNVGPIID